MMAQGESPVWPIVVEATMTIKKICNNGSITNNTSWRSSGYVEIPDGAKKVWLKNVSATPSKYGRVGATTSDTQTSGITMINFNQNLVYSDTERYASVPAGAKYIYASRNDTNETNIIVTFSNT